MLIFMLLGTLHSVIVPLTQGEDELAHYRYIKFITQSGRLPVNNQERDQAWYRSDWPPLYHLVVGIAVSPFDTARPHFKDVGESPRRRLVGEIFYPRLIIYTEDANWPWQDGVLAWHIGRFISLIFAGTALIFTYFTALDMCSTGAGANNMGGKSESLSLPIALLPPCRSPELFATAVTALLAFTPRFLFTSSMLGDDSLFVLISAIFIWLLLWALRGNDRWWVYAILGLLLGFSITTKYSTGLLPLIIIPVVWWRAKQAGWGRLPALGRLAVAWLFTVLGSSWWFGWLGYYFNSIKEDGLVLGLLRSVLATGPDVSMHRIFALFRGEEFSGPIRPGAIAEGTWGGWLTYLFQTFWGVPVLEFDPLFPWVYLMMLLLCLVAAVGLWWSWRAANSQSRAEVGVLLLVVVLLIPFPILRFFLTYNILETGQGRHILYPAAQAIPILFMLGWLTFLQLTNSKSSTERRSKRASRSIKTQNSELKTQNLKLKTTITLLVPALLLAWSGFQLYYMTKTYPDPLPVQTTTFQPESIPQPLKHNFTDEIQFLGYDFQADPELATVDLTLFWKALEQVDENYRVQVQLVDAAGGEPHLTWISHPVNGLYPTRAWDKGDVIRDALTLPLAGLPAGNYTLEIDLLREAENTAITAEPFWIIQIPLGQLQPIPEAETFNNRLEYRLWLDDAPVRHRQTVALSWANTNPKSQIQNPNWVLIGPDNLPRHPVATGHSTAMFTVGGDWPSGDYKLAMAGGESTIRPVLTVANQERLFDIPPDAASQPGWRPLEANFANQVALVGYVLPQYQVEPGGGLPLTLYWRSLAPVLGDFVIFDVLLDEHQQVYGGYDRLPREFYSTILWSEGEVVEDGFAVPVAPDAPPGVYHLHVGLYALATGQPVSLPLIQDEQITDATSVIIGPIKVGGPPPDVITANPTPQVQVNQSFGNEIALLGYDLTDETGLPITNNLQPISNHQTLNLKLYWQAETVPVADYTTFLHLRNADNETVIQKDQPPAQGRYPTSLWSAGEVIVDEIRLPLADIQPGEYTPVIGLYNFETGIRLPLGSGPETELSLSPVQIDK